MGLPLSSPPITPDPIPVTPKALGSASPPNSQKFPTGLLSQAHESVHHTPRQGLPQPRTTLKLAEGAPEAAPPLSPTPPQAPPSSLPHPNSKRHPKGPLPAGRARVGARRHSAEVMHRSRLAETPPRLQSPPSSAPLHHRRRISNFNGSPGPPMRKRHSKRIHQSEERSAGGAGTAATLGR